MAGPRSSIRKLPEGKMQSLRKWFEEKDAQASGASLYGMTPRINEEDESPTSPTVQHRPFTRASPVLSARKTWMAPDFIATPSPVKVPKGKENGVQGRQRSSSERESAAAAPVQNVTSPGVLRRVGLFSDCSSFEVERNRAGRSALDYREGSPVKRFSDSAVVREAAGARRYTPERQRAMSDIPSVSRSKELSVFDRLKKFEEKPSLNSKPVVTILGQKMSSVSNAQRRFGEIRTGDGLTSPGAERNFDRLKLKWNDPFSASNTGKDRSSVPLKQDGKSVDALLSPPSKPPRTFAHDEYLQTKILNAGNQNAQGGKGRQSDTHNVAGIKGRISTHNGGTGIKEEVILKRETSDGYSHLAQDQNGAQGRREAELSHPFPSRLRPISESSALHRQTNRSPVRSTDCRDTSDDDGPIVISLKHQKRLDSPPKELSRRRNPLDKLPETPKQVSDLHLQEFKLRKSYSSECLDKGSTSSLSDVGEEESASQSSRRSSCFERGQGGHHYETLVDKYGYAVPHKFKRVQVDRNGLEGKESSEREPGLHKRRLGPSSSEGATAPIVTDAATPVTDQDVEKVPRKKMNMVRQKINQAYEVLHTVFDERPKSISEGDEDKDLADQTPQSEDTGDSDSIVDVKEIRRRVNYCSSIRLKTSHSIRKAKEFQEKVYPQLFEYALIVGLCTKADVEGYDPYIIRKFPQAMDSNPSVPKFCFPDAAEFCPSTSTATSESYSFVLTDIDGGRLFGYCRRIQPKDSNLPEVLCIVSPVDAFNMYNKLLSEIELRRCKSVELAQELIEASFGRPLPSPGKVCHIKFLDEKGQMETILLDRPQDQRLTNVNYESLLQYLGTDKLTKVFSTMLMERRLILCSQQLSVLTQTIHALVALLYPFRWQHVYIPLLPPDMLDVCAAPMPFIIGILHSHLERVTALELEDVIIVDLDKKQLIRCVGDESTLLPKKVQKALKTALNMCKIDSDAINSQWLMVSEAFLRMFVEMMGHFPLHIATQQDGSKTLQKEQFKAGTPSKGIRQFLEWFTETQMFEVFISSQLDRENWGSLDLFMKRLGELQGKKQADGSHSKGLGKKVKNLGKAIKTKLK